MIKSNKKSLVVLILSCLFVLCIGLSFTMRSALATTAVAPIMQDGAEIRAYNEDGKSGVRFTAFVDDSHFTNGELNDGTIAGIIITKGEVEASSLTHASGEAGGAYAGKVLDVKADRWDASRNITGAKAFNAVVYNIPVSAYGADLTARAYVGIYNESQDKYEYTYSENVCTRSPAELASKALAAGGDDAMLYNYVNGVDTEFTVNGNTEEAVELSLAVGQTIKLQPNTKDLAIALTTDSNLVKLSNNEITVVGYKADNAQAVITAKLGSTTKNITLTVKDEFKDENLSTNLLADFDESYYPGYGIKVSSTVTHTYMRMEHMDAETAKAQLGVDSGVVAIRQYGNYDEVVIPFGKTLNVSEISGIYIKVWVDAATATANNMQLRVGSIYHRVSNNRTTQGAALIGDAWNTIYIARNRLKAANTTYSGYNATTISEIAFYFYGGAGHYYYIDEVGVMEASAEENELINFDSAQDLQLNYIWGGTTTWVSATDSACPAGATGGVARYEGANGDGTIFYFKQILDPSEVQKIIVRAYVPEGTTQFRVFSVGETSGYPNDIKLTAHPGQFYDYEIDISLWTTSLFGLRLHKTSATGDFFIDSITYVAK